MERKRLGTEGEEKAKAYLIQKGYIILDKNFRTKFGEIDLIAKDGNTIVFIEVKTRSSSFYGLPRESVHFRKQGVYSRLALYYLQKKGWLDENARFDVLEVQFKDGKVGVHHIPNAFDFQRGHYFY